VTAQTALRAVPKTLPVVVVEAGTGGGFPVVAVDQVAGARMATEHLLELGHQTVWHLAGPSDWLEAQSRERSWRKALAAAGAPVPPVLRGDWSARSGYELGRQVAARLTGADLPSTPAFAPGTGADLPLTAVFAANDHIALGLFRALGEVGVKVPDDISVVGFDDVPEAEFYTPPLTTIRQDFDEVGKRGMALLLMQFGADRTDGGGAGGRRINIRPTLVRRASTAPIRS
jgi:LacI family transcriptional regulator